LGPKTTSAITAELPDRDGPLTREFRDRQHEQAAGEVTGRGITPAEGARHAGISWPVMHETFAAAADEVLHQDPTPVAHLGIDEHRRGRARFAVDEQTGEYTVLADRWHTCFFDLDVGAPGRPSAVAVALAVVAGALNAEDQVRSPSR
jgi:hypothetical protein